MTGPAVRAPHSLSKGGLHQAGRGECGKAGGGGPGSSCHWNLGLTKRTLPPNARHAIKTAEPAGVGGGEGGQTDI